MKNARNRLSLRDFAANEDGATLIEYGLVAALVSVFLPLGPHNHRVRRRRLNRPVLSEPSPSVLRAMELS